MQAILQQEEHDARAMQMLRRNWGCKQEGESVPAAGVAYLVAEGDALAVCGCAHRDAAARVLIQHLYGARLGGGCLHAVAVQAPVLRVQVALRQGEVRAGSRAPFTA